VFGSKRNKKGDNGGMGKWPTLGSFSVTSLERKKNDADIDSEYWKRAHTLQFSHSAQLVTWIRRHVIYSLFAACETYSSKRNTAFSLKEEWEEENI
jgi:tRNA threonylcarbamoyladenosine modification (KEOPS) complex Cgi121 subunit